jgi:hypothetical protein
LHTKKKSHPWPEKASNGSDAEAISMVASSYVAEQKMKDVTQTPSAAWQLIRNARIYVPDDSVLGLVRLVNETPAPFLSGRRTKRTQRVSTIGKREIAGKRLQAEDGVTARCSCGEI